MNGQQKMMELLLELNALLLAALATGVFAAGLALRSTDARGGRIVRRTAVIVFVSAIVMAIFIRTQR